jgi:hypothetical protein
LQQQGKQWKKLCDCPAKNQQTCVRPDDFKGGRIEKLSRVILNIDYEVAIASMQIGFEVTPVRVHDKFRESVAAEDTLVATNIAGRGTDLETSEELELADGLHVLLIYMPSNRRVERQFVFGRAEQLRKVGPDWYRLVCTTARAEVWRSFSACEKMRKPLDSLDFSKQNYLK